MYIQGDPCYDYHVKTYGHPSKVGFMEIDNLWKAEKWEPDKLLALSKRAGAKYFFALANHHDKFDAYDSKHHTWNSVKVGPKKDIVGGWAKVARAQGLRFGVSNHSSWASRWLQPAYGYDGEGPLAGVRDDAFTLTKADGKGRWWEGLDPQDLSTRGTASRCLTASPARKPCAPGTRRTRAWGGTTRCQRMRSSKTGTFAARTSSISITRTCSTLTPTSCRSARRGSMSWRTTTTRA